MNREIKFRVYDGVDKTFFEIDFSQNPRLWYKKMKDGLHYQQFTGLKDKHGVDIYDGDIVRSCNGDRLIVVVGWKGDIDCKDSYQLAGSTYKRMMSINDCEVIGNIYLVNI